MASFGTGIGQAFEGLMWLAGCAVAFGVVGLLVGIGAVIYLLCR